MQKNKISMMAIATGTETKTYTQRLYKGIGTFNFLAINPTGEELKSIYNSQKDFEPFEYISTDENNVKSIRLDIFLKSVPEDSNGFEFITKVAFFLKEEPRYNKDKTKIQVINAYGDTAWVTMEEFKQKQPPQYAPDYSLKNLRPAYSGEDALVTFVKRFLNIPNYSFIKPDKTREFHKEPANCECQFAAIKSYFLGKIDEIKQPLMALKDNKIKLLLGVRSVDNSKYYQDIFNQYPMSYYTKIFTGLTKNVTSSQDAGMYANTDFGLDNYAIREWTVPTTDVNEVVAANPFTKVTPEAPNWGEFKFSDDLPFD